MTAHSKPDAGSLHAPMADVLDRVAYELSQLSGSLSHVETLVGPLILKAARRDAQLVRQIQDLDHIRQKMQALADFLAALALGAPDQCRVDAIAAARLINLADLAARLTFSDADKAARQGEWGDCELF
ncbi:conserved hypothetical protein [Methylocella tundrae]|uniref:Uncharacterized protein n=1 Tax=Methylocella tundrae TaxID=227605 RepID=A0A8B6M834_METTU|nr:hypothetical protein [Methylocella tundrae]VTZ27653.1 conserved hypothetical protein [Methylocella tundrae]VTZ50442.1 conserved hypothetical protein [Methylocella tundrae]